MTNSMPVQKKERDSNFELLRIIAMFGIVFHHLQQHGIWFAPDNPITAPFLMGYMFKAWVGMLGNWLFILISGYFVCTAHFSWKKVLRLWFQIFSISALLGISAYVFKIPVIGFSNTEYAQFGFFEAAKPASKTDLIRCLMPCYFGNNWFAVAYIVFYAFVPFLNLFLTRLPQKSHAHLIILMVTLGTIVKQLPFQQFFSRVICLCSYLAILSLLISDCTIRRF